ncbi:MAG: response regulator [Myxococcaceae bacterium]|nr:MAG: response regulator [Myxococcaceae bacterium]
MRGAARTFSVRARKGAGTAPVGWQTLSSAWHSPPPLATWAQARTRLTSGDVQGSAGIQGNGTRTVLLVEDDDDVREVVEQILTEEGFQVVSAPDGGAALEVLAQGHHQFCTIILDLLMPGVDGLEFLDRARDRLRSTPVLVFSATLLPSHVRDDPRVKDLIPKPVDADVLVEKIRAHCG